MKLLMTGFNFETETLFIGTDRRSVRTRDISQYVITARKNNLNQVISKSPQFISPPISLQRAPHVNLQARAPHISLLFQSKTSDTSSVTAKEWTTLL